MSERLRRLAGSVVAVAALVVMVVGLWPEGEPPSDASRVNAIASNIKCPACAGASVADAESGIARDFYDFIEEQVAGGMSDGEIYDYWTARFGEQALLSPPTRGWGLALWLLPVVGLAVGIAAAVGLRRDRRQRAAPEAAGVGATGEASL